MATTFTTTSLDILAAAARPIDVLWAEAYQYREIANGNVEVPADVANLTDEELREQVADENERICQAVQTIIDERASLTAELAKPGERGLCVAEEALKVERCLYGLIPGLIAADRLDEIARHIIYVEQAVQEDQQTRAKLIRLADDAAKHGLDSSELSRLTKQLQAKTEELHALEKAKLGLKAELSQARQESLNLRQSFDGQYTQLKRQCQDNVTKLDRVTGDYRLAVSEKLGAEQKLVQAYKSKLDIVMQQREAQARSNVEVKTLQGELTTLKEQTSKKKAKDAELASKKTDQLKRQRDYADARFFDLDADRRRLEQQLGEEQEAGR